MMFKQLSTLVEMEEETISGHLLEPDKPKPASRTATEKNTTTNSGPTPVRTALSALLHHPHLFSLISTVQPLRTVANPGIPLLIEVIETLQQHPNLTPAALLERWRGREDEPLLHKVAQWTPPTLEVSIEKEFEGAMERLLEDAREARIETLYNTPFNQLSAEEKTELQQLTTAPKQQIQRDS